MKIKKESIELSIVFEKKENIDVLNSYEFNFPVPIKRKNIRMHSSDSWPIIDIKLEPKGTIYKYINQVQDEVLKFLEFMYPKSQSENVYTTIEKPYIYVDKTTDNKFISREFPDDIEKAYRYAVRNNNKVNVNLYYRYVIKVLLRNNFLSNFFSDKRLAFAAIYYNLTIEDKELF